MERSDDEAHEKPKKKNLGPKKPAAKIMPSPDVPVDISSPKLTKVTTKEGKLTRNLHAGYFLNIPRCFEPAAPILP